MADIEKIEVKLRGSSNDAPFHDSRADVRTLMLANNLLIEKVNELVAEVNKLRPAQKGGFQ